MKQNKILGIDDVPILHQNRYSRHFYFFVASSSLHFRHLPLLQTLDHPQVHLKKNELVPEAILLLLDLFFRNKVKANKKHANRTENEGAKGSFNNSSWEQFHAD